MHQVVVASWEHLQNREQITIQSHLGSLKDGKQQGDFTTHSAVAGNKSCQERRTENMKMARNTCSVVQIRILSEPTS